ncbi:MAG: hypothetical protein IPM58_04265 [Nitrospira sp.]|nr:hypothetical protein [Nitrospira sp.]
MHGRLTAPAASYLFTLLLVVLSTTCLAGTTAYMKTTEQLDLTGIRLIVIAPSALQEPLRHRAMRHFSRAGLSLRGSGSSQEPSPALLTLTLNPRTLERICPGKVLYAPSLELTELVTAPRTGVVYQDTTWVSSSQPEVQDAVTAQHLDEDLDRLVTQFITDYQMANRAAPSQEQYSTPLPSDAAPSHQDRRLGDLRIIRVSVLAGPWSSGLKAAVVRQLALEGITSPSDLADSSIVDLSLELLQYPLGDQCPGYVLYERGLYLVEEIQVARRPQMRIWSDTWSQNAIQIVPPRSREELEADQTELVRTFLSARHTR